LSKASLNHSNIAAVYGLETGSDTNSSRAVGSSLREAPVVDDAALAVIAHEESDNVDATAPVIPHEETETEDATTRTRSTALVPASEGMTDRGRGKGKCAI
jgi:hypothetical protein